MHDVGVTETGCPSGGGWRLARLVRCGFQALGRRIPLAWRVEEAGLAERATVSC